eukprot:TRINITY_DN3313_c0_g1_i3.p1 TRINITY_DN3313_c0_g1~~TRINITY_DN3313_c0_g1_i3.p1  ORF type:complete len:163 (+),score=48.51 TRINITY_DN3313_c0_g1_i3:39-491(+)
MDEPQLAGLITIRQRQLVREAVVKLLEFVRPEAVALVDAFDIPDRVLGSTIGKYDGNVYEALFEAARKSPLNQTDPKDEQPKGEKKKRVRHRKKKEKKETEDGEDQQNANEEESNEGNLKEGEVNEVESGADTEPTAQKKRKVESEEDAI